MAFTGRLYDDVVASARRHRLRAQGSPTIDPARNPASVHRGRERAVHGVRERTPRAHTRTTRTHSQRTRTRRHTPDLLVRALRLAVSKTDRLRKPHRNIYPRDAHPASRNRSIYLHVPVPASQSSQLSLTFSVGRLQDTVRAGRMHMERQRAFETCRTRYTPCGAQRRQITPVWGIHPARYTYPPRRQQAH